MLNQSILNPQSISRSIPSRNTCIFLLFPLPTILTLSFPQLFPKTSCLPSPVVGCQPFWFLHFSLTSQQIPGLGMFWSGSGVPVLTCPTNPRSFPSHSGVKFHCMANRQPNLLHFTLAFHPSIPQSHCRTSMIL
jgi:hypothetical protein